MQLPDIGIRRYFGHELSAPSIVASGVPEVAALWPSTGSGSTRSSFRALPGSERVKSCNTPGWQEENSPNKCNTQRTNQGMKDLISRGALQ